MVSERWLCGPVDVIVGVKFSQKGKTDEGLPKSCLPPSIQHTGSEGKIAMTDGGCGYL